MNDEDSTRERILSHASERFFRDGFARVSVDEIATELAISKKTIYKYFDSKDDLVARVVERRMGEVRRRVVSVIDTDRNFIEKLDALIARAPAPSALRLFHHRRAERGELSGPGQTRRLPARA